MNLSSGDVAITEEDEEHINFVNYEKTKKHNKQNENTMSDSFI